MRKKRILITGATSGIGLEAAKVLAGMDAEIIITAREEARGKEAVKAISEESGNPKVEYRLCDLSCMISIRHLCENELRDVKKLDILINNAGIWQPKRVASADGIEMTFAVNYLAPFFLTSLLQDKLQNSKSARIVNVASGLHSGEINFNDIEFKERYSGKAAYAQSKLALIMYSRLLAKKLEPHNITVNSLHPGFIATSLARDLGGFMRFLFAKFGKSAAFGAKNLVYAATASELDKYSGEFINQRKIGGASAYSKDMEAAERLWAVSELYCSE